MANLMRSDTHILTKMAKPIKCSGPKSQQSPRDKLKTDMVNALSESSAFYGQLVDEENPMIATDVLLETMIMMRKSTWISCKTKYHALDDGFKVTVKCVPMPVAKGKTCHDGLYLDTIRIIKAINCHDAEVTMNAVDKAEVAEQTMSELIEWTAGRWEWLFQKEVNKIGMTEEEFIKLVKDTASGN